MSDGFIEHLLELLEPFGGVQVRKMFGGFGFFRDGLMFGLVADNTFYLKTDDLNRPEFESLGLNFFEYQKAGKTVKIAYYEAPPEALENPLEMLSWARSAHEAAIRADKSK